MRGRIRQSAGFNLVEVLVTLTMVALLTTTLINFVNDYTDKAKLARARSDLMRLGQMASLAEQRSGKAIEIVTFPDGSVDMSRTLTPVTDYIVEIPSHDPWGNRFVVREVAGGGYEVHRSVDDPSLGGADSEGVAYLLDGGFGRFLCAGPDGVVNTVLGAGKSDEDNDIVVEFRQQPWLAYAGDFGTGGEVWLVRADGTRREPVTTSGADVVNVQFSPDGSRFVGVSMPTQKLVWGNVSGWPSSAVRTIPKLALEADYTVANTTYPLFFPDGNHILWITPSGALRVFDMFNDAVQEVVPSGGFPQDQATWSDALGRIRHSSVERAYYWRADTAADDSIAIAVAPDGKIAYPNYNTPSGAADGIYLVLPDGTGRRRIRPGAESLPGLRPWIPLFWIDTNTLVYYAKDDTGRISLRRVNQDGRFDIPLYPMPSSLGPRDPLVPSISPAGDVIMFFHADGGLGKVVRTDGSGFYKARSDADLSALSSGFTLATFLKYQEGIFAEDGKKFYVPTSDTTISIYEIQLFPENPAQDVSAGSAGPNANFTVQPGAFDLSPDGSRFAVISDPSAGGGDKGVYVFPLYGPSGSKLRVDDPTRPPPTGSHCAVTWIDD